MKPRVDLDKITKGLGGERRGPVTARSGYFGAQELVAEVFERFKAPDGGGRRTDPTWTERRQVPLRRETLEKLEKLAAKIREQGGADLHPMQLAALLLEKAAQHASEDDTFVLLDKHR